MPVSDVKVELTSFGVAKSDDAESEDCFAVKSWGETIVGVLADGIGSARCGREAAVKIVDTLINNYSARPRSWSPQKALSEFIRLINQNLYQESMARFDAPEMASTLAAVVVEGNRLYGVNVGDSRVYLSRQGELTQLSKDHVEDLRSYRHVLSRAVGLAPEVEPNFFESELADGDLVFLCSDGVSNLLDDDQLQSQLGQRSTARAIVASAGERVTPQTRDDMSAIVIDISQTGKLMAACEESLEIPESLKRDDIIDGFKLVKPFQHSDRVWLAIRDGHWFTLKFAPVEARDNEAVLHQFVKETWNATRLEAEFFPEAFVPEKATTRFYVMEFIQAPSLKMLLRSRRLAVDEAIALGRFLLQAAQYLLRYDLVHGDIKPENILVISGYDNVSFKLVDFGSATEVFSITTRAGTASYLAPERFHQAPISERTEIFAIGVTLFEALTGVYPYGEIERFQTPHFHAPKRPATLNPNLPPWLDSLLMYAVCAEPLTRYQNFSEMLFDLDHPTKVEPFHFENSPWIERNPLQFYKVAFLITLAIAIYLAFKLMSAGAHFPEL